MPQRSQPAVVDDNGSRSQHCVLMRGLQPGTGLNRAGLDAYSHNGNQRSRRPQAFGEQRRQVIVDKEFHAVCLSGSSRSRTASAA
jgi:hypothetical protein